jgi:hypothetical protein
MGKDKKLNVISGRIGKKCLQILNAIHRVYEKDNLYKKQQNYFLSSVKKRAEIFYRRANKTNSIHEGLQSQGDKFSSAIKSAVHNQEIASVVEIYELFCKKNFSLHKQLDISQRNYIANLVLRDELVIGGFNTHLSLNVKTGWLCV